MIKVLEGVRVIEQGTFITGPNAGMLLADLGAEVIKVEKPGSGDPFRAFKGGLYSPHFQTYNRNKRSVTLNTKEPEDLALFDQLIADAEHANPSLRHLAAGLQGSLAVSPNRIRLRLTHQGEIREYTLKSGGWRESEPKPTADTTDRFELELNRNLSEKLGHSWFLLNADIFDLMFGRKAAQTL